MGPSDPTLTTLSLLARTRLTAEHAARARAAARRVDWDLLCSLALRGGIGGLVASSLEQLDWPAEVPRAVARRLVMSRLKTEQANRALLAETLTLCAAAGQRGLTLVPLKGMALMMDRPYTEVDLRASVDVDLLAPPDEFAALERLFLEHGYRCKEDRTYFLRHHQHLGFSRDAGGQALSVELHWTPFFLLFGHLEADLACLGRLVDHRYQGCSLRVLDPADTLLGLLLHLANHRYAGQIKWVVDLAEVIAGLDVPFATLRARADRLGARTAVELGLWIVEQTLGSGAEPAGDGGLRGRLLRGMVSPSALWHGEPPPQDLRGVFLDMLLRDHPHQSLQHLLFKLAELAERARVPVPHFLVRSHMARR